MSDSKKQTFLHGTALLAMSTAIVKIIGAFYSIPLKAIIGDVAFGYYSTAYEIYTLLLMISTAGLPVAMSRMISQASSLENYKQVRKIYATARTIFLTLGLLGTALMMLLCRQLAEFQRQPNAWVTILALGPACLLICMMSTYRGFFQGQSNMKPTSVSQVLEAAVKLICGLSLAVALLWYTSNHAYAAGGAIFGVTMSCLISTFYLSHCFRKSYRELPVGNDTAESSGSVAKSLLAIAIPITIGSVGLHILTVLETRVYMSQLLGFMAQQTADLHKGIYNFVQKIFNMPCAFITPITISIIPAITAQITTGDNKGAKITEESAARVTALISMPCAVGLAVLAEPVTALLGGYAGENLALAANLMRVLGICIIFNATVLLTNAIMQAHGHVNLPVINMLIGGFLKLGAIAILTGNQHIGILGTPIGSLLCYLSITVLNVITVRRVLPDPPAIVKNMLRGLLAAVIMGVVTYGAWFGLTYLGITSRIILCAAPIAVGVVVYLLSAIKLKAITREDCLLLPKGEKIANLLHL
ncbi:MAG: polysaccharide biosynthesis protein [Oscillospiraceae bacterium]|nr:polysaccharide biosynthesis protein [Oscillospiraceae bacterium]